MALLEDNSAETLPKAKQRQAVPGGVGRSQWEKTSLTENLFDDNRLCLFALEIIFNTVQN